MVFMECVKNAFHLLSDGVGEIVFGIAVGNERTSLLNCRLCSPSLLKKKQAPPNTTAAAVYGICPLTRPVIPRMTTAIQQQL